MKKGGRRAPLATESKLTNVYRNWTWSPTMISLRA